MNFLATCPVGLEEVCSIEMSQYDISKYETSRGAISFEATDDQLAKFFLGTQTASRVYLKILEGEIRNFDDVYKLAESFAWSKIFTLRQTFKIKTVVENKTLKDNPDWKNSFLFNQKFKDGYIDVFRKETGKRPNVEKKFSDLTFFLYIEGSTCKVYLDMCGMPLSNRGYRQHGHEAPLRENLAGGIIKLINPIDVPYFMDSMLGSGTAIIEAIFHTLNIPSSYLQYQNKSWDIMRIPFLKDRYNLQEPISQGEFNHAIETNKVKFIGNDTDKRSLNLCHRHLCALGFEKLVELTGHNATKINAPSEGGVVFCNPPYAKRLGEAEELEGLYFNYGENLKHKFKGWKAYVLTGNLPLLKKISLRTSKKHILFNGQIECRLAEYDLF
jgi:23S rRNA G2445 N2-methylase RlmL